MKNKFQKSVTKKYKKENKKPLIITGVGVATLLIGAGTALFLKKRN